MNVLDIIYMIIALRLTYIINNYNIFLENSTICILTHISLYSHQFIRLNYDELKINYLFYDDKRKNILYYSLKLTRKYINIIPIKHEIFSSLIGINKVMVMYKLLHLFYW